MGCGESVRRAKSDLSVPVPLSWLFPFLAGISSLLSFSIPAFEEAPENRDLNTEAWGILLPPGWAF